MKLQDSQFTKEFLKLSWKHYGILGFFWGNLILLTSCYVVSPEKFLLMKWGYSGSGKTISDKVALYYLEPPKERFATGEDDIPYLVISSRLTPAGLGKLFKEQKLQASNFARANLILYEDLSKATTAYLQKTAVAFLAALTESRTLDDITSDGVGLGIEISKKKKKCMLSGTPSQLEFLTSQDVFTEYVDRRSLSLFVLLSPLEWKERIRRSKVGYFQRDDDQIIREWQQIICESYRNSGVQKVMSVPDKLLAYNSQSRLRVYTKMLQFKRFPENLMLMIDAIAKGHAILNGRNYTIDEDYEVIDKLFGRFLYLGYVRKKEFLIIEEILRSDSGTLKISELANILRLRARSENLPDARMVERTIRNYVDISRYLIIENGMIKISPHLQSLIKDWEKQVREVIK